MSFVTPELPRPGKNFLAKSHGKNHKHHYLFFLLIFLYFKKSKKDTKPENGDGQTRQRRRRRRRRSDREILKKLSHETLEFPVNFPASEFKLHLTMVSTNVHVSSRVFSTGTSTA